MNTNRKLAFAVLIGIAIGIAGTAAIHAQQPRLAPGYVISESEITDLAKIQEYGAKIHETLAPFNHQIIIGAGKTKSLEGEPPKSVVVMAFDSMEKAQAWYDSPAYQAIKPIRQSAPKSRMFIVEGVAAK
jgi:uncharacterized protein (DUF1330 family)